ncbi:hypothetical protein VC83_04473 [Pseudogymnoascus destructans]|uniref:ERCC4 domain-containing protein n=2 Tax=Pseudogymnoascus destructans TaxID=655981 RepID=L8FSR3_PSED2|nr:uncharacterized protein VC83_04473 [Pseudogymnoascus destructans]ELR02751.1 hypothetical protein GMDG_05695 [Pseudogymnoascus destructans 20631-21]OAF59248.1 hypothetical protein VC83_04473 [Pseudogymnoascus destructans]
MPIEVIDLLSSSSPPPRAPIVRPRNTYKAPLEAAARLAKVAGSDTVSVAAKANASGTGGKRSDSYERFKSTVRGKAQEWIGLDDEDVSTLPAVVSEATRSPPVSTGWDWSKLPVEPESASPVSKRPQHNDFMFLSDDSLDSGIADTLRPPADLHPPPSKRQRVTPEPATLPPLKDKGFRRVVSDISAAPSYSKTTTGPPKASGLKRSATSVFDDDPITFTSSPDFLQLAEERRRQRRREVERGEDLSDIEENRPENTVSKAAVDVFDDDDSDFDLPDIAVMASQVASGQVSAIARAPAAYIAYKPGSGKSAAKVDRPTRVVKTAEQKQAEKEAEAERKQLVREGKARDKQIAADLAKVNTLRIDKKVATPEMIAVFPSSLDEKLRQQAEGFFGKIGVNYQEWDCSGTVQNVLRWKRKVDAKYNEAEGHWEPVPSVVEDEKHVLCYMPAAEFVALGTNEEGKDLGSHVLRMKARFDGFEIIYLIEGLTTWMRKNRNVRNRQFTDAVRRQMGEEEGGTSSQRSRKKAAEYVDEDMIEDALLRLQVIHGVLIHHTTALVETAEWFAVFTQHIATIPYRRQRMALDTAFCMETGQIKTGEDAPDTYVRMLQEVNRVTAPIAYGIAAEYPSVKTLVDGLKKEGKDTLTHVRKSANKDGVFTDKEVGKSVSKRVWSIFTGTDEGSTDV